MTFVICNVPVCSVICKERIEGIAAACTIRSALCRHTVNAYNTIRKLKKSHEEKRLDPPVAHDVGL